jgi:hypothetical protein
MNENPADPLHVENAGPPALNDAELSGLIQVGEVGGILGRSKLPPLMVRCLLGLGLVWPKGDALVGLTARGVQTIAAAARRTVGDA